MDFDSYDQSAQKEELWNALEEEQQLPDSKKWLQLSSLSSAEQERLDQVWLQLPLADRQELIPSLIELAEHDFALDFRNVYLIALTDPSGEVRAAAISGLWEDQDVRLISKLGHFLLEDKVEEVRIAAAQSLAHFVLLGELKKIHQLFFKKAYQYLLRAYQKSEETLEVRRRALESLAYAGKPEVPDLIRKAYQDSAEKMRISAVFAMGRSADRQWSNTVAKHLEAANPAMRYEAARACGELTVQEAVPGLIELIQDVSVEIQQTALWALGQIGGERAERALQRYQNSKNKVLQTAAEEALQELEFLYGDINKFYDSPDEFRGAGDLSWDEEWHTWQQPEEDV